MKDEAYSHRLNTKGLNGRYSFDVLVQDLNDTTELLDKITFTPSFYFFLFLT